MRPPDVRGPRPGHGLATAVLSAVVGAGVAATAGGQPWLTGPATAAAPDGHVPGSVAAPLVLATGLVGLAGAGALLATAGPLRRVLGVLLAALAAGALVGTAAVVTRPTAHFATAALPGVGAGGRPVALTAWPFLAVVGLLVLGAAGVASTVAGGSWRALGRRYQAPSATGRPVRGTGPAADWDDLDAGRDPTVLDEGADEGAGPSDIAPLHGGDSLRSASVEQATRADRAPTETEQRWRSGTPTVTPPPGGTAP